MDRKYTLIADGFDGAAQCLESNPTINDLRARHAAIGELWPMADADRVAMLSRVSNRETPADTTEEINRLVGMGQIGIRIAIECLDQGNHPNPLKSAADLRDIATQLRSLGA